MASNALAWELVLPVLAQVEVVFGLLEVVEVDSLELLE